MRKGGIVLGVLVAGATGLWFANNSGGGKPAGELTLLAHRGVHQPFSRVGLTNETCTAARSIGAGHSYIENTLPSMDAAFYYGADMVELDVHPTTDGEFAVFHDWTLDCRTNGKGVTREHAMPELKKLDVGYGYTSDGGRTFYLRGRGVGLMPTLGEVLAKFPDRRFLINIKSNDAAEADLLHAYLNEAKADRTRLVMMGGAEPIDRLRTLDPGLRTLSKAGAKACLQDYLMTGWYGNVPEACRHSLVAVPVNMGWMLWGWPNRFLQRMQKNGSEVYIGGRADFELQSIEGLDDPADLEDLPKDWKGGVMTDRIDLIGAKLEPGGA